MHLLISTLLCLIVHPAFGPELGSDEHDHKHERARDDADAREEDERPTNTDCADDEIQDGDGDCAEAAAHEVVLLS